MRLFHHSQDLTYRTPFGAVPTGTTVRLALLAEGTPAPDAVYLRVFDDGQETQILMQAEGAGVYSAELSVGEKPRLLWYDFTAECGGETLYYINNQEGLGGVGETVSCPAANSYQITVYDKDYRTPTWFCGRVMYQIFPDRFYGVHEDGSRPRKRAEYAVHDDWYAPPAGHRHPVEDGPACDDFYGGNLNGIRAKLPYLKSLGVGVLYLNPIFDAYSDHKYDTADYKTIDPMFGTEADFSALCAEAERYGIRVILDGVFSHTGADSVYFNKYGNYGEGQGAYRDPNSPFCAWYQWSDYPNYLSWWGCSNLPNVNELEPSYLDYILRSEDAVVKKWLRAGASGWRLDVADELPDAFIQILRQEVKATKPDAVVLGEVWEDASNKTAYDMQREYLLGHELDSVMNYPFREGVLGFLLGRTDAAALNRRICSQMENYPPQALYALMNMLGTHDTMRVKSLLGGMDENCGTARLTSQQEELATARLKLGVFLQMTFYGVPCIYYGDEVGMQGGRDPYNRGTYPWRQVDSDLRAWYQRLGTLRGELLCLAEGGLTPLYAEGDVYVYARTLPQGRTPLGKVGDGSFAVCAVNRGDAPQEVTVCAPDMEERELAEYFTGETIPAGAAMRISLPPRSARLYLRRLSQR